jgi:hypothetical protein
MVLPAWLSPVLIFLANSFICYFGELFSIRLMEHCKIPLTILQGGIVLLAQMPYTRSESR